MKKVLSNLESPYWAALATIVVGVLFSLLYTHTLDYRTELALFIAAAAAFITVFYHMEWGLYLLIFALPFDGQHLFAGLRLTEIIAGVILVVFLIRLFMGKEEDRIPMGKFFIPLALFLVTNTLSAFNSLIPTLSVKRIFILAYLVLLSYLIGQIIKSRQALTAAIRVYVLSLAVFGVYGVYQFFSPAYRHIAFTNVWNVSGLPRITLFYGDPNLLSGYLAVGALLCLSLLFNGQGKQFKWLRIALPFTLISLLMTFSRSGLLAMIAGGTVLLCFNLRPAVIKTISKVIGSALLLLLLLYAGVPKVRTVLNPAFARLTQLTDTSVKSVGARLVAYREAINMTADHPLLGVGPDMFPYEYDLRTGITAPEAHVVPHNLLLEIVAEKGLIGLTVFVLFMFSLFFQLKRALERVTNDPFSKAILQWIIAGFTAHLVLTLFLTGLYEIYFWVLIGLTYALTSRLPWPDKE